jgi:hypothetical protein
VRTSIAGKSCGLLIKPQAGAQATAEATAFWFPNYNALHLREGADVVAEGITCRIVLLEDRLRLERARRPAVEVSYQDLLGVGLLPFGWAGFAFLRGHVGRTGWFRLNTATNPDFVYVHFDRYQQPSFVALRDELRRRLPHVVVEARHVL